MHWHTSPVWLFWSRYRYSKRIYLQKRMQDVCWEDSVLNANIKPNQKFHLKTHLIRLHRPHDTLHLCYFWSDNDIWKSDNSSLTKLSLHWYVADWKVECTLQVWVMNHFYVINQFKWYEICFDVFKLISIFCMELMVKVPLSADYTWY